MAGICIMDDLLLVNYLFINFFFILLLCCGRSHHICCEKVVVLEACRDRRSLPQDLISRLVDQRY